eukprot:Skav214519  [mRNA]  locus=scaffold410:160790:167658:- [translate_table: standard]
MVKAYEEDMEARRLAKLRRERRKSHEDKRRRARSSRGSALVEEGKASSSSGRPRRSASSSALSRSTQSDDMEVRLPEDLSALKSFPLVDDWLMKVRLREVDGRMPKLRFEVRKNPAHWVPGSRMYIDYKPVFYLE